MSSGKSDPEQLPEQKSEETSVDAGPGALRGQVWLTVQTRQAQRLVRGRNGNADKPAIIGLVGFADRLRVIWQAARNDDPYADWWLVKVHEALERVRDLIKNEQAALDAQLEQLTALEVTVAESMKPYQDRAPVRQPVRLSRRTTDHRVRHVRAHTVDGSSCGTPERRRDGGFTQYVRPQNPRRFRGTARLSLPQRRSRGTPTRHRQRESRPRGHGRSPGRGIERSTPGTAGTPQSPIPRRSGQARASQASRFGAEGG